MAGKRSRSKKPSAASGPPEPLTFFIDAALGRVTVAEALRDCGLPVVLHDEVFSQGTADEDWLPEVGRQGWILLTKDDRIRSTTAQREILIASGVRAFILSGANLPGPAMAKAFATASKRMLRVALGENRPFIARVTPTGEVRLLVRGRLGARR
jgi:hypothetical protein